MENVNNLPERVEQTKYKELETEDLNYENKSNKDTDRTPTKQPKEATKNDDGWEHCEICDYKCKKQTTFRKHMNTKHAQSLRCYVCGKLFISKHSLEAHKDEDHMAVKLEKDTSFVFSESMLDDFFQ